MERVHLEPPPGLELPATEAFGGADDTAQNRAARNPFNIFDQPMKVQAFAATPCKFGKQPNDSKLGLVLPQKVSVQEEQRVAEDIARLQYENAMLRQQAQAVHQAHMSPMNGMTPRMNSWWPEDPWAAAESVEVGLQPGVSATLAGLKNASELNGVKAILQYWHTETDRWAVRLPSGEEKFVKIENLQLDGGPSGYYPCYYMDTPYGCPWYPSGGTPGKRNRARTNSGKANGGGWKKGQESSSFGSDVSTNIGSFQSVSSFSDNGDLKGAEISTTIMMRNIPNNYTRDMLLDLLKEHGFENSYDLIYFPIDFQTEVGIGYAFINLVSEDVVEKIREHFHGFTDWKVASQKVCEVSWSTPLQGIQSHIDRYRNSPVMHESVPDEYKPMLFKDGKRIEFPPPTKRIRAPRLRRSENQ